MIEVLESVTGGEAHLLIASARMCDQYLSDDKGVLDHKCMSTGDESYGDTKVMGTESYGDTILKYDQSARTELSIVSLKSPRQTQSAT